MSDATPVLRKMSIYAAIWAGGFAGTVLYPQHIYPGLYSVSMAFAIGGVGGFFGTPAWEQLKDERT